MPDEQNEERIRQLLDKHYDWHRDFAKLLHNRHHFPFTTRHHRVATRPVPNSCEP